MITLGTNLLVADNTGAKLIRCIKVIGASKVRYARLGDVFVGVVKEAVPRGIVKKGEVVRAVVVRQRKEFGRENGVYVRFDENAAVVINKEDNTPRGTRIFGPIAREVRKAGFNKIISLAPEVL